MKWEKVKLGDVCIKIGSGATPKGGAQVYVKEGVSLIRSQNVYNSSFKYEGLSYITEEAAHKLRNVCVMKDDVLLNITGDSVARCTLVPEDILPARVNQHVAILRVNKDVLCPAYLQAALVTPKMQTHMIGLATGQGASRSALTKRNIEEFKISLPPLSVQRKIAEILGAYDDAIENNRRRIELLEKMARSIYRSWFVNFARWEGDCPKEIKNGCLDNIVSRIGTGLNPRKNFVLGNGQNFYVTIKNMTDNTIVLDDKCSKIDDEAVRRINSRSDLRAGDLLFSGIGTIGRVAFIYETPKNWNTSESIFNLRPANGVTSEYLYFVLTGDETQAYVDSHALGVAQRGIRMADLRRCPVLLPSTKIIEDFTKIVKPYMTLQNSLRCMNQNLIRQRDRLLPRLMSGMIDLERFVEEEVANG